jgi:hypothetical protein
MQPASTTLSSLLHQYRLHHPPYSFPYFWTLMYSFPSCPLPSHTLASLTVQYYTLLPATPVCYTILLVVFLTSGHSFPSCPLPTHSPALHYSTTLSSLLHQQATPSSPEFSLLDTHSLPTHSLFPCTRQPYSTILFLPATPVGYTILPRVSLTKHSFPSCPLPLPMHSPCSLPVLHSPPCYTSRYHHPP